MRGVPVSCPARIPCLIFGIALLAAGSASAQGDGSELFEMSIEDLSELQVVTVFRRAETLDRTAASVFVITGDEIRRSGVSSIPEALRLAPGVEVARNGASSWTISIRGFNSDLSNKLLVLIDGRSVYSPLYAGVFWDVQDTLLEDIDRIEVISGPGGTVWGANAVNGVINIITRSAADTHGGFAEAGSGGQGSFGGFRFGGTIGQTTDARVYVKYFDHDPTQALDGQDAFDDWRMAQGGFNLRLQPTDRDRITVRGDAYRAEESALLRSDFTLGTLPDFEVPGQVDVSGYNVLGRWRRDIDDDASLRLQAYFDHTNREIPGSFDEARDTFDLDLQHDLAPVGRHAFAWGAALRVTSDEIGSTLFATFDPAERTDRTFGAFVQDRVSLADQRALLTFGAKFEQNDYSGFESQPNIRFAWLGNEQSTFWAGISRAVRTPARLNTDVRVTAPIAGAGTPIPFYVTVAGDPEFRSEDVLAYEGGYRIQVGSALSFQVAVFDNYYDNLQTQEVGDLFVETMPSPYIVLPARLDNGMKGESYGGTFVANWQPLGRWRLRFQYSRLELDLELKPGSGDVNSLNIAGNSPRHQFAVYSFVELSHGLSVYTGARFVDELPSQGIRDYLAVDLNLAWQASDALRASLTLQNANDRRHREFGGGTFLERRAYLKVAWTF